MPRKTRTSGLARLKKKSPFDKGRKSAAETKANRRKALDASSFDPSLNLKQTLLQRSSLFLLRLICQAERGDCGVRGGYALKLLSARELSIFGLMVGSRGVVCHFLQISALQVESVTGSVIKNTNQRICQLNLFH